MIVRLIAAAIALHQATEIPLVHRGQRHCCRRVSLIAAWSISRTCGAICSRAKLPSSLFVSQQQVTLVSPFFQTESYRFVLFQRLLTLVCQVPQASQIRSSRSF